MKTSVTLGVNAGWAMELIRTLYRVQVFYPCWLSQTDSLDVRPRPRRFIEWTPWLQVTLPCVTFTPVLSVDYSSTDKWVYTNDETS